MSGSVLIYLRRQSRGANGRAQHQYSTGVTKEITLQICFLAKLGWQDYALRDTGTRVV